MREILCAILLLTAALAGCIGADDGSLETSNATDPAAKGEANASLPTFPNGTPAPTRLETRDCYEHLGAVPVPASAYSDRIPEGFSPASFFGEPVGATATVVVFGQACESPDGTSLSRAITYLAVDPPDEWEHPDAVTHGLILSWVTTSGHHAAVAEAWGFGEAVVAGDVNMDRTEIPAAREGTLRASADDVRLELETTAGAPVEGEGGGVLRFFAVGPSGGVTGALDLNYTSSPGVLGEGVVSGSTEAGMPGSFPADAGFAGHFWGFDETESYVDLPKREAS